jgi:hypothetical protein
MNAMTPVMIDLDNLPLEAQQALYDQLAHKFDRKASATKATPFERELFDLLGELCREHGISYPPFDNLMKNYGHAEYTHRTRTIHDVVSIGIGRPLRKPQRLQVYRLSLSCLADFMVERGIPISLTSLLNCAHLLPPAIERHFPGYVKARMLDRVVGLA